MKIAYGSPVEADRETLFSVYADSREDEISQFGWPLEQQRAFLRMQFEQREAAYQLQFPLAETKLIIEGDKIAGRMIVERSSAMILLVDVALLRCARRKGIGSAVIRDLQAEAADHDVPIVLHVDRYNIDGLRFYVAKGFQITGESQINYTLKWNPTKTKR